MARLQQTTLKKVVTGTTRLLLVCGILAPLIYIGSDIIAGMSWHGYSFFSQSVSELRGIGAPTRSFLVPILFIYALLEIAFGSGIWIVSSGKRASRIVGALLIGLGLLDLNPLTPLNASETASSMTNILHILATVLTVLFILLIIGFGAFTNGKWFRFYSIVTLFTVLVAGIVTFLEASQSTTIQPIPWLGVTERLNIYGYMVWLAVLAITLLRAEQEQGSTNRSDAARAQTL